MLAAAGSIFGLFLLSSLYLQNVLGMGPLSDRPRLHPARAHGRSRRARGRTPRRQPRRPRPARGSVLVTAAGMTLLAHVGENGSYLRDVLPGMLVAGAGLGVAVVSVSIAILTGSREDETGMISGLNSTGHEIGGTIGIAIFSTIAAGSGALPDRRPHRVSRTRSSQPGSSLVSPAWSLWQSCRGHATSCRSCS